MSRPSLFPTEMALRRAWDALAEADAEGMMSADEAEAFVAQYVNRDAAIARRDEFADFVTGMEAFADAKEAQARALMEQAAKVRRGVDRMRSTALRVMDELGVDELRGEHRVLKIRLGRGMVKVTDESKIPAAFWRATTDFAVDKSAIQAAWKGGQQVPGVVKLSLPLLKIE